MRAELQRLAALFADVLVSHTGEADESNLAQAGVVGKGILNAGAPAYAIIEVFEEALSALASARPNARVADVAQPVSELVAELVMPMALQLDTQRARASSAEAQSAALVWAASHDLRAPLDSILGYAELLEEIHGESLDEESRHCVTAIVSGVGRMSTMISALGELARLDAERVAPTDVDSTAVAEAAIGNLASAIADSGGRVEVGRIPGVRAVEGQLLLVFQNLIGNSLKYRRDGVPPVVRVEGESDGERVWVRVVDNGIGFPQAEADAVFEVFRRLHTDRSYAGTGIGLAVVKRVIELHGGHVFATSKPGSGSTFGFTLPEALG